MNAAGLAALAVMGQSWGTAVGIDTLLFFGLVVDIAQWVVLRARLRVSAWWIVFSAAGGFVGRLVGSIPTSLGMLVMSADTTVFQVAAVGVAFTTIEAGVGTGQWLVLRQRGSGRSRWILVSTAGVLLFGLVDGILFGLLVKPAIHGAPWSAIVDAVEVVIAGLGYGTVTALALPGLVGSQSSDDPHPARTLGRVPKILACATVVIPIFFEIVLWSAMAIDETHHKISALTSCQQFMHDRAWQPGVVTAPEAAELSPEELGRSVQSLPDDKYLVHSYVDVPGDTGRPTARFAYVCKVQRRDGVYHLLQLDISSVPPGQKVNPIRELIK